MQTLVAVATELECAGLASLRHDRRFDVLVTGVGMVATATQVSKALTVARYDLALNFGVCGSFDLALPPLSAVHVRTDRFSEMGAEDGDGFLSVHELKLLDQNEFPYQNGRLVNTRPPERLLAGLPSADGITVNTVHGNERTIAAVVARFKPQVESMEGAAFMYACLVHGVPFAQVRVVSNFVERRNRASWKLTEAVGVLGETARMVVGRV